MAHQTGENEQALRKIVDFTRLLSLSILAIQLYIDGYELFDKMGFSAAIVDRLLRNIIRTTVFQTSIIARSWALALLVISLLGAKGRKDEKIKLTPCVVYILSGLLLYYLGELLLLSDFISAYIVISVVGYLLILSGSTLLSRLIKSKLDNDIFNTINETFPQEERHIENEYSINLPARYNLKGKIRKSWINIINPFRGILVIGNPGSGKSYFVIRHIITQHIEKGFCMFLYDFKYDDLTRIAYNQLLSSQHAYTIAPKFFVINFDDLKRSHRCNPLDPSSMFDITDATEASRTIMLGLNREWVKKQGDFFVESPINFVTAIIWYLRKYKNGIYCTLPHVIELMQVEYEKLFPVLMAEPEIEVLVNPFVSAFKNDAMEQLEGQVASAKISMARLSSPQLYYVLSGNDFTLDINNPEDPKIVSVGNNPQKQQIYGAVLSLYISRVVKLVNRKDQLKCSLLFDEFPTIYFNGIDSLIATARSNKVSTTLAVQDYSQLKKDYGREQADVIMNIAGNIISGQAAGETAKQLSDRFGKIIQERKSISINSSETSISKSTQLDNAIPPATIATLSSGTFVGIVADNPEERIELKAFHADIVNDHEHIRKIEEDYKKIPVIREQLTSENVLNMYYRIKEDIIQLIELESILLQNSTVTDMPTHATPEHVEDKSLPASQTTKLSL